MAGINYQAKRTYTLVPTAAAAGSGTSVTLGSGVQTNGNHIGARITINITAYTSGSITYTVQGIDPVTGTASTGTILASAALAATGAIDLIIMPGSTVVANRSIGSVMPLKWRIQQTGTFSGITHSIYVEHFGV